MAQLIDATTGNHIWGERYDGDISDIFDLQDRVTEAVVGAIEPSITVSEIDRARRKRPESLGAYECAIRALPAIWSHDTEMIEEGLRLAERAIELDPSYALPKAIARVVLFATCILPPNDKRLEGSEQGHGLGARRGASRQQ